ncbi:hypothetical protein S122051_2637, partial [Staphylococcus aureus subsp. aureus 122051]
ISFGFYLILMIIYTETAVFQDDILNLTKFASS